ncbi:hypothetical protein V1L54_03495 [Streptomyces sp. TRM 70361]|uniref:hypothetical protein n=1 Tax=Streptomyces sp. TRM 70361 TaxID=3116553 RepID=UPI002E7C2366|nr:hypothetical protein [Streptomyces sp. TRM 70361]MEE1938485.1 hypothetical protein [Streptomyces sp. TRM 70361]
MNLKRTAAVSLSTAALVAAGAGVSHADGPKFQNNSQVLSCLTLEVLDVRILSGANNNIDCSQNYEKEVRVESVKSYKH